MTNVPVEQVALYATTSLARSHRRRGERRRRQQRRTEAIYFSFGLILGWLLLSLMTGPIV